MAATIIEVAKAIDGIKELIAGQRAEIDRGKKIVSDASAVLAGIPARFSAELAEIDKYTVLGGPVESLRKDEKEKWLAEAAALQAEADAIVAKF